MEMKEIDGKIALILSLRLALILNLPLDVIAAVVR